MFATCMEGVDGWINGINGWMDGWRGGWMNWWMEKLMIRTEKLYFKLQISYQEELHGSWNQRAEGLRCVFLPEVTTCPVSLLLLWWGYWFGWPLFLTLELKKERFIRISLRFLVSPILLGFMDYNVSLNCFYPWAILALKYILWRNYCIPTLLENLLDLV